MGEAAKRITEMLERLPESQQEIVLAYIEGLTANQRQASKVDDVESNNFLQRIRHLQDPAPDMSSPEGLLKMAGILSHKEGEELLGIIDEGCGRVEIDEW